MSFLVAASRILAKFTAFFVIGTAIVAYFVPSSCTFVKGNTQIIILGIIMLSMGMTLGRQDYRILAQRPFDILVGTVAQFTIMPLIAISLATFFNLSDGLTLGLVLVGCCPGGVSSNIMSFLCKGDVAFSVGMTTVSTLIAPVATPLLVNYLVGQRIDIDPWSMFQFMLMVTIIPIAIGSTLNIIFGKYDFFKQVRQVMPGVAVIGFALIVGGVIAYHGQKFLESGLVIFVCIFFHNAIGYVLGYLAGRGFKMSTAKKRTLSIEVGVQNAGLATGLCGKFFPTSAEAAIASAVSCVWHSISGTILANIFLAIDKKKAQGTEQKETVIND